MIYVLFIVILNTITCTMQSMEIVPTTKQRSNSADVVKTTEITIKRTNSDSKSKDRLKKSSSSSSSSPTRSFSRKSSGNIEQSTITKTEHPFIIAAYEAIQTKDYSKIEFYLTNPHLDPNMFSQTDIYGPRGCTVFHIFARAKAYKGIQILFKNPCVDSTKRDAHNNLATQYLNENTNELTDKKKAKLRIINRDAFCRATLDEFANQRRQTLKPAHIKGEITKDIFIETIQMIKMQIEQIRKKQGDSALPESAAKFPEYADEKFMMDKMWYILSSKES